MKFYIKEAASNLLIQESSDVVESMKGLVYADQESFWLIMLNRRNKVIRNECIALGGVTSSTVDFKILFRRLIQHNATSFIAIHNHPSGDSTPSKEDIILSKKLKEAANLIGFDFLDHIIIGEGHTSLVEEGIL